MCRNADERAWEQRVEALDEAGHTRYLERTATMLGDLNDRLFECYGGDLRRLREEAGRDPGAERRLLKQFKGLGDVGIDIFFREVQVTWDELFPFADQRALDAAGRLKLPKDPASWSTSSARRAIRGSSPRSSGSSSTTITTRCSRRPEPR